MCSTFMLQGRSLKIGTIHEQGDIKPGKLVYNLVVTRHSHSSENVNTDVGQLCTRSEHCHTIKQVVTESDVLSLCQSVSFCTSLHWLPV